MSESNAVTVNVNGGGGGRQRGPGLFSNLGRAPWYVQLALLIVIGYVVLIVGFEILANVYDGSSCCLAPITNPGAMLQNRRGGYAW